MSPLTGIGLCLIASAVIVRLLSAWCRPVRHHDLTRPAEFVDQVSRQPNNELAGSRFRLRWEAGGHNVRELPLRPEPAQVMGWEDDGGACA